MPTLIRFINWNDRTCAINPQQVCYIQEGDPSAYAADEPITLIGFHGSESYITVRATFDTVDKMICEVLEGSN